MLNVTVELFISEYFLIRAVLGKYLEDGKKLFMALSKIFLLPNGEVENLYRLSENETAKAINTDKDYMQHQRMRKYAQIIGTVMPSNFAWEEVVRIKGNAILAAQSQNMLSDGEESRNMTYTRLAAAATSGMVSALRVMGILQCEGIFFTKDEKGGIKNLSKAANWNDSVSTLALLHYQKDTRENNLARLRQEVAYTPFDGLYSAAAEKYGEADGLKVEEAKLLNKSFNSGVLKRETYDPKCARVLNSKALYMKDKEKAVFTLSKELICAISDLPLKLSHERIVEVSTNDINKVAVRREREISAIIQALQNSDLRELTSYRPLCLCCNSKYILNMYARALKAKSLKTHVETIDVGELTEYDFEPSPNNVFVRSIDEDKDNHFLLFFCGDISERKIDAVKCFLQSARRANFHLNSPSVTLNLSAVLPICFCDECNARALKPYCDVIQLSEVAADEMQIAVKDVIANKAKTYGIKAIKLNGDIAEIFDGYDIDTAEKLIDDAVRSRRSKGAVITLTRGILQEFTPMDVKQKIGFGGDSNGRY